MRNSEEEEGLGFETEKGTEAKLLETSNVMIQLRPTLSDKKPKVNHLCNFKFSGSHV